MKYLDIKLKKNNNTEILKIREIEVLPVASLLIDIFFSSKYSLINHAGAYM